MPKLKTNRGAAKRFKKTANGKFLRSNAYHRHILTKKSRKRKRILRHGDIVEPSDLKRVKRLLPYL